MLGVLLHSWYIQYTPCLLSTRVLAKHIIISCVCVCVYIILLCTQSSCMVYVKQIRLLYTGIYTTHLQKGTSSMSLAVYEHHTEIAMLLVHRGAYVNIVEEV